VLSCSHDAKASLVGKWKEINGDEVLEFFPDGTISTTRAKGNHVGKFSFPDPDHIKIELGGLAEVAGPLIGAYTLSSGRLTITIKDDKSIYERTR